MDLSWLSGRCGLLRFRSWPLQEHQNPARLVTSPTTTLPRRLPSRMKSATWPNGRHKGLQSSGQDLAKPQKDTGKSVPHFVQGAERLPDSRDD